MDLLEVTGKERVSRQEAAKRLRALATALGRTNEVEYERGDLRFSLHVPDELDFKVEIELQDDEWELEVEMKWSGKPRGGSRGRRKK